ncbi:MAG: HypC/HybG/HupF family hydrogenase formation chaperone [Candidatus Aenigmarchaeota archaeon]|nr:HypC/HybG/HupF family hydrogenase formation chaperone [Candidatus Aenigmarchaeota archaeon]
MCLAIPGKITEINGETATVDFGGLKKSANISLVPNLTINDYILVHAGFAIQKVDKEIAKKDLGLLYGTD